jgi:hypothetical protein
MSADPEHLARRYGALATVVRRGGRAYPAAYERRTALRVAVGSDPLVVDPGLRAGGAGHLAAVRERVPWMYDGELLGMDRIEGGLVTVAPCRYFDRMATGDALWAAGDDALRDRADQLAFGDPLRLGTGRAAGFGVTTVATLRDADGGRVLVLGRRDGLPIAPGAWHVVPAGMAELSHVDVGAEDPFRSTAVEELREELGVAAREEDLGLLGIGWDLLRLVPDVVYRLDLDLGVDAVLAGAPRDEHSALEHWPVTPEGLAALWAAHGPRDLVAPGAAAIALLEASLGWEPEADGPA